MTQATPCDWFGHFYRNPAIQALASAQRWTISGRLDDKDTGKLRDRKAPIDVRHLIDYQRLRGAWATDAQCLINLAELSDRIPLAANAAFYLQASTDGLIVIDIEPKCPEHIAKQLLAMPGLIYTETSMSGKGYHLVARLPANTADFPNALGKKVLQHEEGWYEILLEHWVTFTRNPISPELLQDLPEEDLLFATVDDLYAELAKKAKPTLTVAPVFTEDGFPDIDSAKAIIRNAITGSERRLKTLEDFKFDHSRFEFSTLGVLYRQMCFSISDYEARGSYYSPSDKAWLLFKAATEVIDPRPKHLEVRNGRPFLLQRAADMVAMNEASPKNP